ncbi:MAG: hypothetical protein AMJ79_00750 [Phycisphaerae bacterium SM23_30]|nr:MAG: hypothetical protein AMJ79_00750 [Phycisphaerae bacterium SM23_30]
MVPRHVLGGPGHTPPSEKLNIAGIGVGGQGKSDLENLRSENIVALCDVDQEYAAKTFKAFPQAKVYNDFRIMLEEQKDIDAVVVATPDHTHAVIAMAAMKMGKHVYCQKPLTHKISEARALTEAARKYQVVTQMGIHIHATASLRLAVEMLKTGAIGKVREVHLWCNRGWGLGNISRPQETPPVPDTLDWDLWLGPAPARPYHPVYLPVDWRCWRDFGTASLGDMGCHIFDVAAWALDLGPPSSVYARSAPFSEESYQVATTVHYEFPAQGDRPALKLTWYDGGMKPPRPKELEDDRYLPANGGLYIGEEGALISTHFGPAPQLLPLSRMQEYKKPEPFLGRIKSHYDEWVQGCKGGPKPSTNFDYSGPLTETVLLGNVAVATGKKLYWDGKKITNEPEANQYLEYEYRPGWIL